MKKQCLYFFTMLYALLASTALVFAESDVKGGKDHPLLSRMPDFHISEYKEVDFGAYKFIGADKKGVSIEGRKYYIRYVLNKGAQPPGELKIRRNVQNAIVKIGGQLVFDEDFNRRSTLVLKKANKETWIEVNSLDKLYSINIVEREAMEQVVKANADAMGKDIGATGHVAVYDIYFDTGKADIKPESHAAIAEIAKLLKDNAALKLHVVGHTDTEGSFDSNMKLSKDRAEAVMKALITKHGISSARLKANGVSSLSPVASNRTEEGKAKNRRVELVEQ
jgi:outer membrane protein OmpA-like peptidoglycan-associated protein